MYSVVVGNVGTVAEPTSEYAARITFGNYVYMSRKGHGRVANEAVALFCDGELIDEYCPLSSMEYD